jgi:predicted phosphodiesterase
MADGETTLEEIEREQPDPRQAERRIAALQEALSRLQERRHYVLETPRRGNTVVFGIASDLHVGSLHERQDAFGEYCELLQREKIATLLIAGDILDGHGIYRGQEFELYAHGYHAQRAALRERAPRPKRLDISFITGNHDYSFKRVAGVEPGPDIADDTGWRYVGADTAWVELRSADNDPLHIGLYHPDGGSAYALSYKPQKLIEAMPGGQKPDIAVLGHYHKMEYLPQYRNVGVIQAGCFQSQTPYMARKPVAAHVGGWLVEVVMGPRAHLTSRLRATPVMFYEPEENENRAVGSDGTD